ncbi:MAG: PASTA domain-containing protein, partial [Chloroflexi bacterium]|nr:PASTA domain-containing protein [Chloroflexota bacterium]
VWGLPAINEGRSLLGSVVFPWDGQATATATPPPASSPTPSPTGTPVVMVRVPRFIDQQLEVAKSQATQMGLKILLGSSEYSDNVPEGVILDQSIKEGDEVPQGTVVEVSVSMGKKVVNVPPLVNVSQDDATASLDKLNIGYVIQQEPSAKVPAGVVIRQSHVGEVPVGTRVTLVVSVGDKVQVPNVFGFTEKDAQKALKDAGLGTADVNYQTQKDMPPGVSIEIVAPGHVLSATPDFKEWVNRGTVVHLAVRKPGS